MKKGLNKTMSVTNVLLVITLSIYSYNVREDRNEVVKLYNQNMSQTEMLNSMNYLLKDWQTDVDTLQVRIEKHRAECPHYKNKLK